MGNQTPDPTGQSTGQSSTPAQGTEGTQQPGLDPVEEQFRKFQSRADSYAKGVQERLKKAAEALNVPSTDEPAQATPATQAAQTPANQTQNPLTQWARDIETVYKVDLNPNDPEAALVNQSTPDTFRTSYVEALRQKAARLSTPAPGQQETPTTPITPTTAGGVGTAPRNDLPSMTEQLSKLQEHPLENKQAIKDLVAKIQPLLPTA